MAEPVVPVAVIILRDCGGLCRFLGWRGCGGLGKPQAGTQAGTQQVKAVMKRGIIVGVSFE
jgi:hypothetical protein